MCGITGILNCNGEPVDPRALQRATQRLRHRGPDDSGYFLAAIRSGASTFAHDADTLPQIKASTPDIADLRGYAVAFGFRRLSIQDLSIAAHQPMSTPDLRYTLVYNGEIYNFVELRRELEDSGWNFKSHSDTEVLLAAYAHWGRGCLERLNGMWAFAVWDDREKILFAARDRFGVKPFYYAWDGRRLMFASEIAPFREWMALEADDAAVSAFLADDRVNDSETTFYKGIRELRGSHCLTLRPDGVPEISRYYRVPRGKASAGDAVAIGGFREKFLDAVRIRMRSDVPVGYALSGGMDSSSIVAAARRFTGPEPAFQNVFSSVYPGRPEDESSFIDAVVQKTGFTPHRTLPNAAGFLKDLDAFIGCHEEPLNNLSYYAQYKLRELERAAGVTVSLDGHGADEILGGYDHELPGWIASVIARRGVRAGWCAASRAAAFRGASRGEAGMWMTLALLGPSRTERVFSLRRLVVRDHLEPSVFRSVGRFPVEDGMNSVVDRMDAFDQRLHRDLTVASLPHQLMRADRSSMAFSLECRFPFLDVRVVESAFALPEDFKIRDGVSKWILREAMRGDLPDAVRDRRDKKGFPVPERSWLREDLRGWTDSWVYSEALKRLPWIRWKKFETRYRGFRDHKTNWGRQLWAVLSVALWKEKCLEGRRLA